MTIVFDFVPFGFQDFNRGVIIGRALAGSMLWRNLLKLGSLSERYLHMSLSRRMFLSVIGSSLGLMPASSSSTMALHMEYDSRWHPVNHSKTSLSFVWDTYILMQTEMSVRQCMRCFSLVHSKSSLSMMSLNRCTELKYSLFFNISFILADSARWMQSSISLYKSEEIKDSISP